MAASLDSSYILAPALQDYFVTKDTGLPLTNGRIYFYKDQARTVPKPVFELVSAAPGGPYTYNPLPNPITLSSVGTIVDANGVDIVPYFYPYDAAGEVELYYIVVFDMNGVLQFTREAWPNFTTNQVLTNQDITNFIANGQFLAHNNIPASSANNFIAGVVSQPVTQIAPGGWTFERPMGSTATDIITFPEYLNSPQMPTGNPRYALQLQTTVAGADQTKNIGVKFPGVNTFASDTLSYNFYFEGQAVNSNVTVQIEVIKFFGTGGTPTATQTISKTSVTLLAGQSKSFNVPILFGINTNTTLGTNNDDYVQIVIQPPPAGTSTIQITDVALTLNDEVLSAFPTQTSFQQLDQSLAGYIPVPDPNAANLYLPILLGSTGFIYDSSHIGSLSSTMYTKAYATSAGFPVLAMDGTSYLYADYSSLGIPYSRLGNFLIANSSIPNTPMTGTGPNFITLYTVGGQPTEFLMIINGGTPGTPPTVGNSGFSISGSAAAYTFTVPAIPTASTYFTFRTTEAVPRNFVVWYQINSSAAPVVTGTLLPVVLIGTETAAQVVTKTLMAINQYQYYLPNLSGVFLRALDTTGIYDLDYASRTIAQLNNLTGANLGSLELQAFLSHTHTYIYDKALSGSGVASGAGLQNTDVSNTTGATGGSETRPVNFAVNYFIYY